MKSSQQGHLLEGGSKQQAGFQFLKQFHPLIKEKDHQFNYQQNMLRAFVYV